MRSPVFAAFTTSSRRSPSARSSGAGPQGRFEKATVFVEVVNPMVVGRFKEKPIEGSNAKFTWGVKGGPALAALLPGFRFVEERSLTEGMAAFMPI